MKKAKFWIIWSCLACLIVVCVFFVGDMLECEFPYFITLTRVRNAKSLSGDDATAIIARQLSVEPHEVDYHRCSYCKNFEGAYPAGMIRVQVLHSKTNVYGFAYNPSTGIIQPADSDTASMFQELGASVVSATGEKPNNTSVRFKTLENKADYRYWHRRFLGRIAKEPVKAGFSEEE